MKTLFLPVLNGARNGKGTDTARKVLSGRVSDERSDSGPTGPGQLVPTPLGSRSTRVFPLHPCFLPEN